nr:hypothetical protein [Candidatus Sigynarchaeota archaeon]
MGRKPKIGKATRMDACMGDCTGGFMVIGVIVLINAKSDPLLVKAGLTYLLGGIGILLLYLLIIYRRKIIWNLRIKKNTKASRDAAATTRLIEQEMPDDEENVQINPVPAIAPFGRCPTCKNPLRETIVIDPGTNKRKLVCDACENAGVSWVPTPKISGDEDSDTRCSVCNKPLPNQGNVPRCPHCGTEDP